MSVALKEILARSKVSYQIESANIVSYPYPIIWLSVLVCLVACVRLCVHTCMPACVCGVSLCYGVSPCHVTFAWVTQPEHLKDAKDEVKRPKGPPSRCRGPEDP